MQGFAAGVRGPDLDGHAEPARDRAQHPRLRRRAERARHAAASRTSWRRRTSSPPTTSPAEINIGDEHPAADQRRRRRPRRSSRAWPAAARRGRPLGGLWRLGRRLQRPARQDVGNKIKVTPHVNESNQVRLEIEQESSAAGAAVGALGAVPITKRTANTTVVVQDQQTVVIGGLMRDEYTDSATKIPVLGDLPVLGALFRQHRDGQAQDEPALDPDAVRDPRSGRSARASSSARCRSGRSSSIATSCSRGKDWKPPRDWSRTNGLVEDIRKTFRRARGAAPARGRERGRAKPTSASRPSRSSCRATFGTTPAAPRRPRRAGPARRNAGARAHAAPRRTGAAAGAGAGPAALRLRLRRRRRPQGETDLPFRINADRAQRRVERVE